MRVLIGQLALAVAIAALGGVCWTLAQAERRVAGARGQLATLQYAGTTATSADVDAALRYAGWTPILGTGMAAAAHDDRATAAYWQSRYEDLTAQRDAGDRAPGTLLLAANASFRASQAVALDRAAGVRQLDAVIKTYADVLKNGGGQADAAYNYEFVVRMRDALAHNRIGAIPAPDPQTTLHGHVGAPPKGVEMSKFKVMIPKRGDERKQNDEAGKPGERQRKG
jgi:hypothetical protein